jgi:PAS domain S-box-containing protein
MNVERRIHRLRRIKWSVLVLLTLFLTTVAAYYYLAQDIPFVKGLIYWTIGVLGAAAIVEVGFRVVESLHRSFQREITERQRAEETLRERTQLLERTFVSLREAVFIVDAGSEKITDCNPAALEMFGYSRQEMLGQSTTLLHVDERTLETFREHLHSSIEGKGFLFLSDFRMKRKDGTVFPTEHNVTPLEDKDGTHTGWVNVVRDITEHKQAEQALEAHTEQLRILAARLAEVEEAERQRIARELHDQVGQNLTALGINLNIVRSQVSEQAADLARSRLDDSLALVAETTERIRHVMADLRPPVLDDYGLVAALRWYGEQLAQRAGVAVVVRDEELAPRLNAQAESALFRIAQEALTNVVKHAQATQVTVAVEEDGRTVRLVVADDGMGFEVPRATGPGERAGWGLFTMAERAEGVGGHFHVESRPGQGTLVVVEVER